MEPPVLVSLLFQDDEARWQAIRTRNTNADGFFVYGVRSTKIYCRPACKARLARRANVSFYDDALAAQAAGFRACKRCKPQVLGFMPEDKAVTRIREFVRTRAADESTAAAARGGGAPGAERMSLAKMANEVGLSKWHFHRVFKKCVGVTPVEYLRLQRQRHQQESSVSLPNQQLATLPSPVSFSFPVPLDLDQEFSWMGQVEFDNALIDGGQPTDVSSRTSHSADSPLGNSLAPKESLAGDESTIDPALADLLDWPDDWWNTTAGSSTEDGHGKYLKNRQTL
jgi:methylphosphotriester-DNA--protein-cysteine methyltransferase